MNINNIRPLGNQLLIEVLPPDKQTPGGILLPDNQIQQGLPVKAFIKKLSTNFKYSVEEFDAMFDAALNKTPILVHLSLGFKGSKFQLDNTHYLINKELVLAIL